MNNPDTNPYVQLEDLIKLTNDLSDLFEKENQYLVTRCADKFSTLQSEKAKLSTAYASAIKNIANDRSFVSSAGSTLLCTLRDSTTRFNKLAADQSTLLEGAHRASSGIIDTVKQKAQRDTANSGTGYNHIGHDTCSQQPVVVSLNKQA